MTTNKTEVKNLTKEGIQVKVGQVWEDLDKRNGGRRVRVVHLWHDGKANVRPVGQEEFGRVTTISINRMHKHSTGFKLIKDA